MTKATQRTYLYHYCIPLGANGNGYYHGVISVSDPISSNADYQAVRERLASDMNTALDKVIPLDQVIPISLTLLNP